MRKGTQRRLAIGALALTTAAFAGVAAQPASAFPPGHKVFNFNYKLETSTRIAKLKKTISPPVGTFSGGVDLVTGAIKGAVKLPPVTFGPLGSLSSVTAAFSQQKPVSGHIDLSKFKVSEKSTFLIRIVSAYGSAPPLNLVGKSCVSATPITVVMNGVAKPGSISKLKGIFTIPKFKSCGAATALLNKLLPGPGNTFTAVATPTSPTPPTLPVTLPSLPVTLPSLPVTLPTLPVTLPTLPVTLPTLPVTLPSVTLPLVTLPATTWPTLPATLPTLPVTLPSVP
jgi:hypothetical protein